MEIAKEPSSKLDRGEGAVKTRLLKLKHQHGEGFEPAPSGGKPSEAQVEKRDPPGFEPGSLQIHNLSKSTLLLSEDLKHGPALRLALEACQRPAAPKQEK
jgi:hypothetical protein